MLFPGHSFLCRLLPSDVRDTTEDVEVLYLCSCLTRRMQVSLPYKGMQVSLLYKGMQVSLLYKGIQVSLLYKGMQVSLPYKGVQVSLLYKGMQVSLLYKGVLTPQGCCGQLAATPNSFAHSDHGNSFADAFVRLVQGSGVFDGQAHVYKIMDDIQCLVSLSNVKQKVCTLLHD